MNARPRLTPVLAVVGLLLVTPASGLGRGRRAHPGPARHGTTSQAMPVAVTIHRRHAATTVDVTISWATSCTNGYHLNPGATHFRNLTVRRGRFHGEKQGNGATSNGFSERFHDTVDGTLARAAAIGTFSTVNEHAATDGSVISTCSSGSVRWSAH